MKGILGALIVSIIIVVVAMYIVFLWFGGFISHVDNAKQTAMNMAEKISYDLALGTGLFSCRDFDLAVFPDYAIVAKDSRIKVVHRTGYCSDSGECEEGTCSEGECIKEEGSYKYKSHTDKRVCSPYFFDKSAHTTHCPDKLIINFDWENKIVRKYCICATGSNILTYPKRGLTCANMMGGTKDWVAETTSQKARDLGQKAYDKMEKAFEGEDESES